MKTNRKIRVLRDFKNVSLAIVRSKNDQERFLADTSQYLNNSKRRSSDEFWNDLIVFYNLLDDYFNGRYNKLPMSSLLLMISTFLYLISPYSIINTKNRFLVFLEKTFVVVATVEIVKSDVEEYKNWRISCG